eukprot:gene39179-974_t
MVTVVAYGPLAQEQAAAGPGLRNWRYGHLPGWARAGGSHLAACTARRRAGSDLRVAMYDIPATDQGGRRLSCEQVDVRPVHGGDIAAAPAAGELHAHPTKGGGRAGAGDAANFLDASFLGDGTTVRAYIAAMTGAGHGCFFHAGTSSPWARGDAAFRLPPGTRRLLAPQEEEDPTLPPPAAAADPPTSADSVHPYAATAAGPAIRTLPPDESAPAGDEEHAEPYPEGQAVECHSMGHLPLFNGMRGTVVRADGGKYEVDFGPPLPGVSGRWRPYGSYHVNAAHLRPATGAEPRYSAWHRVVCPDGAAVRASAAPDSAKVRDAVPHGHLVRVVDTQLRGRVLRGRVAASRARGAQEDDEVDGWGAVVAWRDPLWFAAERGAAGLRYGEE